MSDKDTIIKEMDALITSYHEESLPLLRLIETRGHIATLLWRLSGYVKQTYGGAELSYAKRKWAIASHVVAARNIDAKAPMGFLEHSALKTPEVMKAQEEEIWAAGEREELKERIRTCNAVLQAMSQAIAEERQEKNTQNYTPQA